MLALRWRDHVTRKGHGQEPGNLHVWPWEAQPSPKEIDRLAGDALNKLQSLGFKNLWVLDGGFEAWANAGNRADANTPENIMTSLV